MTPELAIEQMTACAIPEKAAEMAAYHKAERPYLGTATPEIDALCKAWRADITLEERLSLCEGLWDSNIHEARIAAAKLLTQARIKPNDSAAWALICSWIPQLDAWAIADAVAGAASKRIVADPSRLDDVEAWTQSPLMWERRAALVATLPFARLNNLKPVEEQARERVLSWAASFLSDKDWFIQKAVASWLRDLSKHDPARTEAFLAEFGDLMKTWARKESGQYLG
ncbi:DNA alkylation repair protein [Pseudorhodobacter turbinis]|uniref:DNA alkylation repair protein n=1 Tax=Pseudorhodobacter turbinis TaxID=2500533 RepID=A0A4P8EDA2_9RHOB|nr:DNA alkylation repair protein [Pseudorhodobacter turbinis]QCO54891.1 DNA alkylation repair protein [Pseudorhodobacter turbinis]